MDFLHLQYNENILLSLTSKFYLKNPCYKDFSKSIIEHCDMVIFPFDYFKYQYFGFHINHYV